MICGGSPCQDFSIAGGQAGSKWKCKDCEHEYNPLTVHYSKRHQCPNCGSENLDKTRSSLLVEWLRIIRANKPIWGIYENVKNIVGKKFQETFNMFINELHEYGYNTYYKVLNSKDFGVPQNRERVYLIIILKEFDNGQFKFPEGFDNGKRLKDVLEDEVDDKYYINTPKAQELIDDLISNGKLDKDVSNTIKAGEKTIDLCPTQRATRSGIKMIENNSNLGYRIRKLTPKECWRLMGFSDEDFEKAQNAGVSNTQLYKQAGNSIVTDVLYYIFKELYNAMPYLFEDLKVSSYFSGIGAFEIALNKLFDDINSENFQTPQNEPSDSCGLNKQLNKGRNVIIYDDYNCNVRADQTTIGTITSTIGHSALRSSYKLIEMQ